MTNDTKDTATAAASPPEGRAFIDGAYRDARGGATFACIDPSTDTALAMVADCDAADIDDAVAAARGAFEDGRWRALPLRDRKRILRRLADLLLEHRQELAELEARDMGKPVANGLAVDVPSAADCIAL